MHSFYSNKIKNKFRSIAAASGKLNGKISRIIEGEGVKVVKMGAESSKSSGGYRPEFHDGGSRTETDFSGSRRHPAISIRSKSVPTRRLDSAGDDDIFEDQQSLKEPLQRHRSNTNTMVVVNRGQDSPGISEDPLLKKLEELYFFYPLMHDVERRSGLFGTHNRKALAEIQSKVKNLPALKLVRIYEDRLRKHADAISIKQGELTNSVKETDLMTSSILKSYSERAKITAKHVDRLTKLDDLKRNMNKCNQSLNECIAVIELLNNMLPEDERLEPFLPWVEEADEEASECIANS